jgi:hypothetical protein
MRHQGGGMAFEEWLLVIGEEKNHKRENANFALTKENHG